MDKGAQEEVDRFLIEIRGLSDQVAQSKDPMILAMSRMVSLGLLEVWKEIGNIQQLALSENETMQKILKALPVLDTRLAELEKSPDRENVELENLRRKLRAQENKLKKHAPMLEFLEQWVEAQRNRYIGEHR